MCSSSLLAFGTGENLGLPSTKTSEEHARKCLTASLPLLQCVVIPPTNFLKWMRDIY